MCTQDQYKDKILSDSYNMDNEPVLQWGEGAMAEQFDNQEDYLEACGEWEAYCDMLDTQERVRAMPRSELSIFI